MRSEFHRQRIVRMAALAILIVGAVACGDDSKGAAAADESPLTALYGGNKSPAEQRKEALAVEEAAAQCMKEAGWQYKPVDYAQYNPQPSGDENLTQKEMGAKYAYGVVHNYELYELPNLEAGGDGATTATVTAQGIVDPNQEYMSSLSSDEMMKYQEALYGKQAVQPVADTLPSGTGPQIYTPPPLEEQGCQGKARLKVVGKQAYDDPDISKRLQDLSQKLEQDPRVVDAQNAWGDCLFDINPDYDFATSNDTYTYVDGLMQEAKGLKMMPADPQTGQVIGGDGTEQVNMMTVGPDGKGVAYVGSPKPIKTDRLEELRKTEKELWDADQKCQKQVGLAKIRKDAEQELVDTLYAEFPDLQKNQS
jgi:hypothetical protein